MNRRYLCLGESEMRTYDDAFIRSIVGAPATATVHRDYTGRMSWGSVREMRATIEWAEAAPAA